MKTTSYSLWYLLLIMLVGADGLYYAAVDHDWFVVLTCGAGVGAGASMF